MSKRRLTANTIASNIPLTMKDNDSNFSPTGCRLSGVSRRNASLSWYSGGAFIEIKLCLK